MKLWAIAYNTFRENIRDRVLYNLLVFAVLLIGLSVVVGKLSLEEQERITIDVGLSSISVFGVLMAVFLGIGLVSKEIDKKTIYTLIAKPVPRYLFILGRFCGLLITIGVNILIMTVAFNAALLLNQGQVKWLGQWALWQAVIMIYFEMAIITAVAMVFSTFSTSTLSAIFTLSFVLIGRLSFALKGFAAASKDPFFHKGATVLYYLVPNLGNYVRIESALYGQSLPPLLFLHVLAIGVLTAAFFLIVAMAIFQRRDFV